jgi:SpoVK/Ycf46/Vps4 family AAA+-type ATPase
LILIVASGNSDKSRSIASSKLISPEDTGAEGSSDVDSSSGSNEESNGSEVGGAVWYGIKFGTEKFRDRMMEMQLSSPPTSDPFDSSFEPEEESTSDEPSAPVSSGDISLEDAMDRLLSEFPEATIDIKPTEDENYGVDLSHLDDLEKNLKEELAESPKIRKAMKVDYKVDYEELSKYYSTTEDTINQTVTHLKSGRNIMLYGDPGTGKTALANL